MKIVIQNIFLKPFSTSNKLHKFYNDLPFLPERIENEKVEKFVCNLNDEREYVVHIKTLK